MDGREPKDRGDSIAGVAGVIDVVGGSYCASSDLLIRVGVRQVSGGYVRHSAFDEDPMLLAHGIMTLSQRLWTDGAAES